MFTSLKTRLGFENQDEVKAKEGGSIIESITNTMDLFNASDKDDQCNFGKFFELSYKHRIMGWLILSALGLVFGIISSIAVFATKFVAFGIFYGVTHICLIAGSLFLFGPVRQCKSMFNSWHRALAASVYIVLIALTLYVAIKTHNGVGTLICALLQFISYIWYTLTSIPGGQTCCETMVRSAV